MNGTDDLRTLQKAMRRISRALDLQSRRIDRAIGLTLPQLVVLGCIRDLGEVTSRAIAEEAQLSPPTVAVILDKLEAKGMIERYRAGADRRVVFTRLTPLGEASLDRAPSPAGEGFRRAFLSLAAERRAAVVSAFETVAAMLGENGEETIEDDESRRAGLS